MFDRRRRVGRKGGAAPPTRVGKLTFPSWYDGPDQLGAALLESYAESLGAGSFFGDKDAARGVTIGIVDSALGPPPDVSSRYTVEEPRDYIEETARDPTGHGTLVFGAMSQFAGGATFRFYRLLGGEPKRGTDLLEPIEDAASDGVDLLNVSASYQHSGGGGFRVPRALRIEGERRGLTAIAAAGNAEDDPAETVHYPARFDEVVSVGGFVPECRGDVARPESDRRIWIDTSDRTEFPDVQGPLCNRSGCDASSSCKSRYERWWWSNVRPVEGNPDTLAPVYYPTADDDGPFLVPGTSFAAPIVTGIVAAVLERAGAAPHPGDVRRAVRNCGVPIDDGEGKKCHGELALAELR